MSLKTLYASFFNVYERYDLTSWDHLPQNHLPVYGVYHVFCAPGWQQLVKEQIDRLKVSGLWAVTKKLFVSCIITSDHDIDELHAIMADDSKWETVSIAKDKTKFEFPALEFIRDFSQTHSCLLYYFHTKGVSFLSSRNSSHSYRRFSRNVRAWRRMMEFFIIDEWKIAINVLMAGYDTYGTLKIEPPYVVQPHYSGNFWWAKSEYLAHLPMFSAKQKENRFSAETWILNGHGHFFSTFDDKAILYSIYMPEQLYLPHKRSPKRKLNFVIAYNIDKFKRRVLKVNASKTVVNKFRPAK